MTAKPIIHAESARAGIRLGLIAMQGKLPPPDIVNNILQSGTQHMQFVEFPIEMLQQASMQTAERRRFFATKALEMLLVRSGDSTLLSNDDLERIVAKSWRVAALMEREDMAAQTIDTLNQKA